MHCSFGYCAVFIQHWSVLLLKGVVLFFPIMSSQSPSSAFFSFSCSLFSFLGRSTRPSNWNWPAWGTTRWIKNLIAWSESEGGDEASRLCVESHGNLCGDLSLPVIGAGNVVHSYHVCRWHKNGGMTRGWLEGRAGIQGFLESRRSGISRTWRCSAGTNAKSCTWEGRGPGRDISWCLGEQLCRKGSEAAGRQQLPDNEGSWPRASWTVSPGTQPADQGKRLSSLCITSRYITSSFKFLIKESCW